VDSIEELNALLEAADEADDARRIGNRANSVGHDWAFEKTLLRPLPVEPFDTALRQAGRHNRPTRRLLRRRFFRRVEDLWRMTSGFRWCAVRVSNPGPAD